MSTYEVPVLRREVPIPSRSGLTTCLRPTALLRSGGEAVQQAKTVRMAILPALPGLGFQRAGFPLRAPSARVAHPEFLVAAGGRIAADVLVVHTVVAEVLVVAGRRHERGHVARRHTGTIATVGGLEHLYPIGPFVLRRSGVALRRSQAKDDRDDRADPSQRPAMVHAPLRMAGPYSGRETKGCGGDRRLDRGPIAPIGAPRRAIRSVCDGRDRANGNRGRRALFHSPAAWPVRLDGLGLWSPYPPAGTRSPTS